jgi:hypothetical protein
MTSPQPRVPSEEIAGLVERVMFFNPESGELVSGNSFATLGLRPYAGRLRRPSDDMQGAAAGNPDPACPAQVTIMGLPGFPRFNPEVHFAQSSSLLRSVRGEVFLMTREPADTLLSQVRD